MQIATFPASIAVLLFTASFLFSKYTASKPLSPQTEISAYNFNQDFEDESARVPDYLNRTILYSGNWLTARQSEELLLLEGGSNFEGAECCPTENIMTAPIGGINKEGNYVELYREGSEVQQFYEVSCKEDVIDKPCRFMEKRYHNRSRCVQKYTFSFAIVIPNSSSFNLNSTKSKKEFSPFTKTDTYMLDYIQLRSGCSCDITPNKKLKDRKNSSKSKKKKQKHANDTID